jgi:subtilisin family serine protease
MRFLVLVVLAVLAVHSVSAEMAPLLRAAAPELRVDGEYIVLFKDNIPNLESTLQDLKTSLLADAESQVKTVYNIGSSFKGLHLRASAQMVETLRAHSSVALVEENQVVSLATPEQVCRSESAAQYWNLQRLHARNFQLDGTFRYDQTAADIDAYIVDTGILTTHVEFGGRAIWGANYADSQNTDCNGHGTHVAGTIGGTTAGVAKEVTLIGVKVLSCSGSGTTAGVISGVQFTADNANRRGRRAVANMSLGGGYSAAMNNAVAAAVRAGVTFVVAAGNENQDACNVSPASEPLAITVGATFYSGSQDIRASFSNHGTCVDIFAPGQNVRSAWIGSNTAYQTISGTSMASPLVAGVAAVTLSANPGSTPDSIKAALNNNATPNVVNLQCSCWFCNCESSPNRLVHLNC